MRVDIENYRGHQIMFDTDSEGFLTSIDDYCSEKKSYSSCKKGIDEYIKENSRFTPFDAINAESLRVITIVGIRKDGRFIESIGGKSSQLSDYYEKDYLVYSNDFDPIIEEVNELEDEAKEIRSNIKSLKRQLAGKSLKDLKKELGFMS